MVKPSERIAEIARADPYGSIRATTPEEHYFNGLSQVSPIAIVQYLDEQHELASKLASIDDENKRLDAAVSRMARELRQEPISEKLELTVKVDAGVDRIVEQVDNETRRIEVLTEQLKALTPRGVVLVEKEGRVEVWFTGEVFPPVAEYQDLSRLDVVLPESGPRKWENVERWRFKA